MVGFRPPKPHALFWLDIEATGLPVKNDFSNVHMLEVAVIITDFDLNPMAGYTALITPTADSVAALKANPDVIEMHRTSGLIGALKAAKEAGETETVEQVEQALIDLIKKHTTFDQGEFMIAGSGVGRYDYGLLDRWMPRLTNYFAYYPFDIGVMRRTGKILSGGRDLVNPNTQSYGDAKVHRALADVEAHIEEARDWQAFFVKTAPHA